MIDERLTSWAMMVAAMGGCSSAEPRPQSPPQAITAPGRERPATPSPAPGGAPETAPAPVADAEAPPPQRRNLTIDDLRKANGIVRDRYPGPFEETYPDVVVAIGAPHEERENMFEWFGRDEARCLAFYVTKARVDLANPGEGGHAASGMYEVDLEKCGPPSTPDDDAAKP